MGTFIVAYLVIWLAVACYVALLGVRQHQLEIRIEELRTKLAEKRAFEETSSKAA